MRFSIGFLAGVLFVLVFSLIIPFFSNGLHSSCYKCGQAKNDIKILSTALSIYGLDNRAFPPKESVFSVLINTGVIDQAPIDPWNNEYQYTTYSFSNYTCFMVWSHGSDGKPGGSKEHEIDIRSKSRLTNCITGSKDRTKF